jgi:hypothetical protein
VCTLCPAAERLRVHHRSMPAEVSDNPRTSSCSARSATGDTMRGWAAERVASYTPPQAPLVPASSIRWLVKRA